MCAGMKECHKFMGYQLSDQLKVKEFVIYLLGIFWDMMCYALCQGVDVSEGSLVEWNLSGIWFEVISKGFHYDNFKFIGCIWLKMNAVLFEVGSVNLQF